MTKAHYTLAELAQLLGAELHGDATCLISGIATLQTAGPGQVSFLDNKRYRKFLASTKASAVILAPPHLAGCPTNVLVLNNPYLGYAQVARLFDTTPSVTVGIHPTAVVDPSSQIDPSAAIGPLAVIGPGVVIGERVIIGSGCVIGANSNIGADSRLWANVTIYHEVKLGQRCLVHSGAVIGSDGFGFAQDQGVWKKVPQIGSVLIGNDVEIGANTCIDRGALEDTVLGDGVKVDNLVQIAHNVKIGAHTAIAGCVGIAGSTTIGKYCALGGRVGINGHLTIADRVIITGGSLLAHSIDEPGSVYSSAIAAQPTLTWRKNEVRIHHLDELARRVRQLEKALEHMSEKEELI